MDLLHAINRNPQLRAQVGVTQAPESSVFLNYLWWACRSQYVHPPPISARPCLSIEAPCDCCCFYFSAANGIPLEITTHLKMFFGDLFFSWWFCQPPTPLSVISVQAPLGSQYV